MAWILLLSLGNAVSAGEFTPPGDGEITLKSGTYTIDGEQVRIQVEVARVNGFDGPVAVGLNRTSLTPEASAASNETKPEKALAAAEARLSWKNADRTPKSLSFSVSRQEFFSDSGGIEVSLKSLNGSHLGETTVLAAIPAGAGEKNSPVRGDRRAVADASNSRRLVLTIHDGDSPRPPSAVATGKAVADAPLVAVSKESAL